MLAFETLLLGLVFGAHPVGVVVTPAVAAVEVRLDGRAVGRLTGAPWRLAVEFGARPQPHDLAAVGFDASGKEVARVHRWVNLPFPAAEAAIALERDGAGRVVAARLSWDHVRDPRPGRVEVTLDGRALEVADPARVPLPAHDPAAIHVVSATIRFESGGSATAGAAFGGDLGEAIETELTAVPVEVEEGVELPSSLVGWFEADGQPARVVAVERPAARAVMVVDMDVLKAMAGRRRSQQSFYFRTAIPDHYDESRLRVIARRLSLYAIDAADDALFLTFAVPEAHAVGSEVRRLFPTSPPYRLEGATMEPLLGIVPYPDARPAEQLLGNAVCVSALKAAAENRPRAVVLLLGGAGEETGSVPPADARAFLADLRVPLHVWSVKPEIQPVGWGNAVDVGSQKKLAGATESLVRRLAAHRIVWIEGAHLPQRIVLTPAARGARIAL
jgi:hypothetical protein